MEKTRTVTIEVPELKNSFTSSQSFTDEEIQELGKELLSSPTSTASEPLYNKEQMLKMFSLGFNSKRSFAKACADNYKMTIGKYINSLSIGESVILPFEKWNLIRSVTSKAKRKVGKLFNVRKLALSKELGDIEVIRLK